MSKLHQMTLWDEPVPPDSPRLPACPPTSRTASLPLAAGASLDEAAEVGTDEIDSECSIAEEPSEFAGLPSFKPLRSAIDAGIFGITATGPMEPDEHEIAALVQEHSNELAGLLIEIDALTDAVRTGVDPRTGRMPRTPEAAEKATTRWRQELEQAKVSYANMLAAVEEGFGLEAGRELDHWIRSRVAGTPKRLPYDPGHPWHYYWAGDGAEPIAFVEIPPSEDAGRWLERDLPKNPAKRLARLRELLTSETERLTEDRRRYEDIIARGAEALSQFDREIAYGGNDELARAGTIALKYNHIRMGLGRVRWLRQQLGYEERWEPIRAKMNAAGDQEPPGQS